MRALVPCQKVFSHKSFATNKTFVWLQFRMFRCSVVLQSCRGLEALRTLAARKGRLCVVKLFWRRVHFQCVLAQRARVFKWARGTLLTVYSARDVYSFAMYFSVKLSRERLRAAAA
eukprot:121707_1